MKAVRQSLLLLSLTFLVLVDTAAAEEPSGLIASWSFDEGRGDVVRDSSGNGHHGTIHNGEWCEGRSGSGLEVNGKDAWVDCGKAESLSLTQAVTIEAWVRPENARGHLMTILAKGTAIAATSTCGWARRGTTATPCLAIPRSYRSNLPIERKLVANRRTPAN